MFAVQARRLEKTYHTGAEDVPAIRGIDLDIRQGEFVSIMGPSGSGKSTLMHLVGLLDTPTGGAMKLMDRTVSSLSKNERAHARRETLGFVFQAFHLMPRVSAVHNVMLPMAIAGMPLRRRRPRAERILKAVGLTDRAGHKPSELSGGQKQRVAIARALALDPPILLADEPTGNLDSVTSAEIMRLFQRLHASGKTVIQVTHDREMASYGDRILHFKDGLILKDEHIARRVA